MIDPRETLRARLQGRNLRDWRSSLAEEVYEFFVQQRIAWREETGEHVTRFQLNKPHFLEVVQFDNGVVQRVYYDFDLHALSFNPLISASFTPNWAIDIHLAGERNDNLEIFWRLPGHEDDRPGQRVVDIMLPAEWNQNDWFRFEYDEQLRLKVIIKVASSGDLVSPSFGISPENISVDGDVLEMASWEDVLTGQVLQFILEDGRAYRLDCEERDEKKFFRLRQERVKEDGKEIVILTIPVQGNPHFIDELFPAPFFDDPYETDPGQDLWAKSDVKKTFGGLNWEIIDVPLPSQSADPVEE